MKNDNAIYMYIKEDERDIDKIIDYVFDNPFEINIFIGSLYFVSEVRPKILKKKQ